MKKLFYRRKSFKKDKPLLLFLRKCLMIKENNLILLLLLTGNLFLNAQTSEYATWIETVNDASGTGTFVQNYMPDFTWTAVGTISSINISNSELFTGTNNLESVYGEADNASNINMRLLVNTGVVGDPIDSEATLTINFNSNTPSSGWAFCVTDIDVDQAIISATDEFGSPVSAAVIDSWFEEVFDANEVINGIDPPTWDGVNSAIIGSADADGIFDTVIDNDGVDSETASAWFSPDISLSSLTVLFQNQQHGTPSCHIYLATLNESNKDSDGDGLSDQNDLDDDNDGILDSDENVCTSLFSEQTFVNDQVFSGILQSGITYTATLSDADNRFNGIDSNNDQCTFSTTNYFNSESNIDQARVNVTANQPDAGTLIIEFSQAVTDLNLHWAGLDYSVWDFSPNSGVVLVNLIGNSDFDVSGSIISDNNSGNGVSAPSCILANQINSAYGTALAQGTYTSLTINLSNTQNNSDGMRFQISEPICLQDTDGDGVFNHLDLDSDNDGIPDIVEAGGVDTNGDGQIDYPTPSDPTSMVDLDGDGFADTYDDTDTQGATPGWVAGTPISNPDSDGDGLVDALDLDADNDGIPDLVEAGGIDINGDGLVDTSTDADGDGFADVYDPDDDSVWGVDSGEDSAPLVETDGSGNNLNGETGVSLDSDGDGLPDYIDLDADNDGIPDLVEANGIDTNGDGRVDTATDADGDGFADIYDTDDDGTAGVEDPTDALLMTGGTDTDGDGKADDAAITFIDGNANNADTDGDGKPDHLDLDAENDGIPDFVEAGATDPDNDGMVDTGALPWDADGDGLADIYDENASDGPGGTGTNGTALIETTADSNGDGIINATEMMIPGGSNVINADGDAYPNHLDLDADNDGITDVVENAGGDVTADDSGGSLDGIVGDSPTVTDTDNNGWHDPSNSTITDTDSDGIPDYLDIDADNDGIPDYLESVCSTCPTFGTPTGSDTDGDGILDIYESLTSANANGGTNTGTTPNEDDDDGTNPPDYLDTDSDNDGANDWSEGFDTNGDGQAADDLITLAATYETNNGSPGHYPTTDTDSDGIPDWMDNQPGLTGYDEATEPPFLDPLSAYWQDSNNNGLADIFDPDTNGTLAPTPDNNGGNDNDWRDMTYIAALPVELSSFEAKVVDCSVRLDWVAQSEENFRAYVLERSFDGDQFDAITWVNSAGGTGTQAYIYLDKSSSSSINYYRLKMIDLDGSFEYSSIIVVSLPCNQIEREIQLFPNPIGKDQNLLNLRFFSNKLEAKVIITDMLGKPIRIISTSSERGWNTMNLDISNLPSGTYFTRIDDASLKSSMIKFIKVE